LVIPDDVFLPVTVYKLVVVDGEDGTDSITIFFNWCINVLLTFTVEILLSNRRLDKFDVTERESVTARCLLGVVTNGGLI